MAGAAAVLALSVQSCGHELLPFQPTGAKAVLISFDGLVPNAITAANMPTLLRMAKEGAASLNAKDFDYTMTLPSHTAMLTGVGAYRHGINFNDDTSNTFTRVTVPTVFDVARQAGLTSAMYVGKSKLSPIVHNGAPTYLNIPGTGTIWKGDSVAAHVMTYLSSSNPNPKADLMFIHFPDIDVAGHAHGWMQTDYINAVKHSDSLLAVVWAGLKQAYGKDLVIIVTSDHGGEGNGHNEGTPIDRTVPWIAWGRFVAPQTNLNSVPIRNVDAAPTLLWVLGIRAPIDWDGVPVKAAFPALGGGE